MEKMQTFLQGRRKGEFAKEIGISAPYLSQILSGMKRPSYDLMVRIERATGGEVDLRCWADKPEKAAS